MHSEQALATGCFGTAQQQQQFTSFNVATQHHQDAHQQVGHFSADDPLASNFDIGKEFQNSTQVPGILGPPQAHEGNHVSETNDNNLMEQVLRSLHEEKDLKAFEADKFTIETLPKYPPPKSYCI